MLAQFSSSQKALQFRLLCSKKNTVDVYKHQLYFLNFFEVKLNKLIAWPDQKWLK